MECNQNLLWHPFPISFIHLKWQYLPVIDKAPRLSISIVIWILSSDTICQLNQFHTNSEAAMLSSQHFDNILVYMTICVQKRVNIGPTFSTICQFLGRFSKTAGCQTILFLFSGKKQFITTLFIQQLKWCTEKLHYRVQIANHIYWQASILYL